MNDLIERIEAAADMQREDATLLRECALIIIKLREIMATWRLLAFLLGSYLVGYVGYDIWKA